jgi:hydrogenase nickel incorporation protein HypB
VETIGALQRRAETAMCEKCGCSSRPPLPRAAVPHRHAHPGGAGHVHAGDPAAALLAANERHAAENRGFLRARGCFALNLRAFASSRAAELVRRLEADHGAELGLRTIDAARLDALGASHGHGDAPAAGDLGVPAMDAHMIGHALDRLDWAGCRLVVIANAGSAVCQAVYDLGETARATVFSVHEGERKPLKTPLIFENADLVLVNEMDDAAACGFDRAAALANIRQVAPTADVIETAPATGAGLPALRDWLIRHSAPPDTRHPLPKQGASK